MKKEIRFGSEVMQAISNGVEILAKTVGSTLGPGGRNVIFDNWGWPLVTKDGVTVARQIELEDKWENIGAQMVKQVANKTCKDAGDGTTTATILANAILKEGIKAISFGKFNPIDVQRGINKAVDNVINYIEKHIRQDIMNDKRIREISRVSANWDSELGDIVADAIINVGIDGHVDVEDKHEYESKLTIVDGINFDRGYRSIHFVNDEVRQVCTMENPYVLLASGKMNDTKGMLELLKQVKKADANLFIVADDFDPFFLEFLVTNKVRAGVKVCCIKAPHYKDMREGTMNDMAILLNTTYFDPNVSNIDLEDMPLEYLGKCDRIVCNQLKTSFMGFSSANSQNVDLRIKELQELVNTKDVSEVVAGNAKLRIKQIQGKAAHITIGANSEIEFNEKKDRVDDALHAVKAAIREGIVPGGGYSYLKAIKCPALKKQAKSMDADGIGAAIIQKALSVPFAKLLSNAGLEQEFSSIAKKIWLKTNYGFNIKTKKFENLLNNGVIDPWTVTKSALRNAASVAGLMLTSEAIVAEKEDEKEKIVVNQQIPNLF